MNPSSGFMTFEDGWWMHVMKGNRWHLSSLLLDVLSGMTADVIVKVILVFLDLVAAVSNGTDSACCLGVFGGKLEDCDQEICVLFQHKLIVKD